MDDPALCLVIKDSASRQDLVEVVRYVLEHRLARRDAERLCANPRLWVERLDDVIDDLSIDAPIAPTDRDLRVGDGPADCGSHALADVACARSARRRATAGLQEPAVSATDVRAVCHLR